MPQSDEGRDLQPGQTLAALKLWEEPEEMFTCTLCHSTDTVPYASELRDYITNRPFTVLRCHGCGLAFTSPQPEHLGEFYPRQYRRFGSFVSAVLQFFYARKVQACVRALRQRGRALEIGCGSGWMLRTLHRAGWQVVGNERVADTSVSLLPKEGIPIFVGGLEALQPFPQFDLIILFQVLEHLKDPLAVLRQCSRLLVPGGTLVVAAPNLDSWQAKACGRAWFHLDVPRHLFHFTPSSLERALDQVGLQVTSVEFHSFEHDPYGWVQSILNRMKFPNNHLTRMLMGMDGGTTSVFSRTAVLTISAVLLLPSVALSIMSWMAGSGAIMQVWASKRNQVDADPVESRTSDPVW